MLCNELMNKNVCFNYKNEPIINIINNLVKSNSKFSVVLDNDKSILGIITPFDIIKRIILNNINLNNPIIDYITSPIISCLDKDDISYAISKIADYKINQIIIVNGKNNLLGFISFKELAMNKETSIFLNDLLSEFYLEETINPIKLFVNKKKI